MQPEARLARHRRTAIVVIGLAVLTAAFGAQTANAAAPPDSTTAVVPADQPERGLVYRDLRVSKSGACRGQLVIANTGRCTHGPDAPPPGMSVGKRVAPLPQSALAAAAAGPCVGDGTSGNRVQMMYVHAPGNDRFAQYKASFEQWSVDMDTIFNESAKETGGTRHVRFVHDAACTPIVLNVTISASALSSFNGTINALTALGYNRADRKYSLFGDSSVYCGIGEFAGDDRKVANNRSNFGPDFARSDSGCWGGHTIAHELGHNLGAVSYSAPNSSGGAHCTDEYDVMCYSDSPNYPPMRYICTPSSRENRFDCNHNDYYHTNPPAGNYLATHWNMADSVFLVSGVPGNDFSLAVSPGSGSVAPGGSVTATASTATTSGSAQTVTFSASGLPSGTTATFSPTSVTSGGSSTVTLRTSASTPAGTYTITITGTGTGATKTAIYRLTVGTVGGCTGTNAADVTIPDLSTVESPITIAGCNRNGSSTSTVAVNIVHTYIGDLVVNLVAPDGTLYLLHNRAGGSADNINQTYTVNLSSEAANGTWKLRVQDAASADTGYINSWTLTL